MANVMTKSGDAGVTSLRGSRVSKLSPVIALLGKLDTVNSIMGAHDSRPDLQDMLYKISAFVADFTDDPPELSVIEEEILAYDRSKIGNYFVRPFGFRHLIRATIREAELQAWAASEHTARAFEVGVFLNRLSDLYFILAELENGSEI